MPINLAMPLDRRLLMTSFGWNDSGGGTTVPRLAAKELARRGWDVTVFHAAVQPTDTRQPYELREWNDDGVRLMGVHNRAHGLFDFGNPRREIDDPPISAAFQAALDRVRPSVVHFHNLHNLGAALMDHTFARGIPAYFSTHNYWLICPRAYLLTGEGAICPGPGNGSTCAACNANHDHAGYRDRLAQVRARAQRSLTAILAVSEAVCRTLVATGYPAALVDVVRQAMPHENDIWQQVGRDRMPGRRQEPLTVAFLGSAYPHKGPQLLVEAAQRTTAAVRVEILGEVPPRFAQALAALDRRGVVTVRGSFSPDQIGSLLAGVDAAVLPSMWWDCAPLAAAECRAAGIPLVVPRLGGLPEAVRDDVDGLVFDALDPDDLARRLDRLALEPGLLERLQGAIEPPRAFERYIDELEAYYAGDRPGRVTNSPAQVAVRWQGDHGLPTSLSIINDRVTERLPGPVQRVRRDASTLDAPLPHAADVEVRHQWPPDLGPARAGRLAVIQPWEFGAVPRDWVAEINAHVDELWVPSEYVREMYLAGGVAPERVVSIPNGVDLDVFAPATADVRPDERLRFLFVGGLIWRKAPDILLSAWRRAFADRDDVTLVVKDFGAEGVYRDGDRSAISEYAGSGARPRIELLVDELAPAELAALYRSCDVLVHPYRGEGFAMPVLEAMACGLPVIVTAGGPTDEFCPPEAGWRIRAGRAQFGEARCGPFETAGRPWVLKPDEDHLVELLREAASSDEQRRRRGAAARAAAERLSWDAVADRYRQRISALVQRRPRLAGPSAPEPFPLEEDVELRVLATPAWRGEDQLDRLLAEWQTLTTPATAACLYLLADPQADGAPADLEARVLSAAAAGGVALDDCADINVIMEPLQEGRDERLHAAIDVFVVLHPACAGHQRMARAAGNTVVAPGSGALTRLLSALAVAPATA
ncbi:MAG TPA: glycosyltransferase [Solirubrobacteraceae bacterium]